MPGATDKVTRMDADLVDSAIAEGRRQQRTGRQQLEHWALVGRSLTAHETASTRRVHAALNGDRPTTDLNDAEGRVFNAEVRARITEKLATADYRGTLAARGVTTVALNEAGELVEYRPDGTTAVLEDE